MIPAQPRIASEDFVSARSPLAVCTSAIGFYTECSTFDVDVGDVRGAKRRLGRSVAAGMLFALVAKRQIILFGGPRSQKPLLVMKAQKVQGKASWLFRIQPRVECLEPKRDETTNSWRGGIQRTVVQVQARNFCYDAVTLLKRLRRQQTLPMGGSLHAQRGLYG